MAKKRHARTRASTKQRCTGSTQLSLTSQMQHTSCACKWQSPFFFGTMQKSTIAHDNLILHGNQQLRFIAKVLHKLLKQM